ncbi:hypothetical protein LCGC14_2831680 [marine sediment metagenome]|uniref:Lcl C-terminal domain-containing protein n=1 Tax=marine sediment metagenome TaxID=412755 RepID=A0A0F9AMC0_9ZZZZ
MRGQIIQPAGLIALPKTGQTTGYRTGDDGDYEYGHPRTVRFQDTGNGTILDHVTGLEWVKQPQLIIPGGTGQIGDDFGGGASAARGNWAGSTAYVVGDLVSRDGGDAAPYFVCNVDHTSDGGGVFANDAANWDETVWAGSAADLTTPAKLSWNDGIDECLALDYGGRTDWRLPSVLEMFCLAGWALPSPCLDATFFPDTQASAYWTSTTRLANTTQAFNTGFYDRPTVGYQAKTSTNYIRPVRGGVPND